MSKTVTACQSNYIPWKGYFDLIAIADEFVIYDDVQYTKKDWRNRNRIKTPKGPIWLTIPVRTRSRRQQKIRDAVIVDQRWTRRHWRSIEINYAHAHDFATYRDFFRELYLGPETGRLRYLSDINHRFLTVMCGLLEIETKVTRAEDLDLHETDRVARLVEMCHETGATRYVVGPRAMDYISEEPFRRAGIELEFMDYSGYAPYEQVHPPFIHEVSIVDLLLNLGTQARTYLKTQGGRTVRWPSDGGFHE